MANELGNNNANNNGNNDNVNPFGEAKLDFLTQEQMDATEEYDPQGILRSFAFDNNVFLKSNSCFCSVFSSRWFR